MDDPGYDASINCSDKKTSIVINTLYVASDLYM